MYPLLLHIYGRRLIRCLSLMEGMRRPERGISTNSPYAFFVCPCLPGESTHNLIFSVMHKNIHIGSLIRQKLDQSGMPYKDFAHFINCERQSLYYLFSCRSIDIERLILIGNILNYDFIRNVYLNSDTDNHIEQKSITINIDKESIKNLDNIILKLNNATTSVENSDNDD